MNTQVQFQTYNRSWKGASVGMVLNDSDLFDGRPIYLCIGHFSSKKSAEALCDKLNAGEITPYDAALKSMKRYSKWVNNPRGMGDCIGREQLIVLQRVTLLSMKLLMRLELSQPTDK